MCSEHHTSAQLRVRFPERLKRGSGTAKGVALTVMGWCFLTNGKGQAGQTSLELALLPSEPMASLDKVVLKSGMSHPPGSGLAGRKGTNGLNLAPVKVTVTRQSVVQVDAG